MCDPRLRRSRRQCRDEYLPEHLRQPVPPLDAAAEDARRERSTWGSTSSRAHSSRRQSRRTGRWPARTRRREEQGARLVEQLPEQREPAPARPDRQPHAAATPASGPPASAAAGRRSAGAPGTAARPPRGASTGATTATWSRRRLRRSMRLRRATSPASPGSHDFARRSNPPASAGRRVQLPSISSLSGRPALRAGRFIFYHPLLRGARAAPVLSAPRLHPAIEDKGDRRNEDLTSILAACVILAFAAAAGSAATSTYPGSSGSQAVRSTQQKTVPAGNVVDLTALPQAGGKAQGGHRQEQVARGRDPGARRQEQGARLVEQLPEQREPAPARPDHRAPAGAASAPSRRSIRSRSCRSARPPGTAAPPPRTARSGA